MADLQHILHRLAPIAVPSTSPNATFSNWARSYSCTPATVFEPETNEQVELIVEAAGRQGYVVRAAGTGHSPSDLACTTGYLIRTHKLNKLLEVNAEKNFVVAQGGIRLDDLHLKLAEHGLAMMNVGSISEQSLAGIVTTATHGTGIDYQVMSTHVLALTLLLSDGSYLECSRTSHEDIFLATLCGMGATGFIISIKLLVEPAFHLKEYQETVPLEEGLEDFEGLVHSSEHVRFWYFPQNNALRVSRCDRTQEAKNPAGSFLWDFVFAHEIVQLLLFIGRWLPFVNTWTAILATWVMRTKSVGVDDSWKIFNVDCRYPQFTIEWAIPFEKSKACLLALREWYRDELGSPIGLRPHFPIEIRFSAADDIWLSPSHGRKTCWLGIAQYKPYGYNVPYRKLFARFEDIVQRYGGRPHWAKAHRLRPDGLRQMYPRLDDFIDVLAKVDPSGMWSNEYIRRHIYGDDQVGARVFKERVVVPLDGRDART